MRMLDQTTAAKPPPRTARGLARHYGMAIPNWVGHNLHNSWGILNVFDMAWLRPMQGGLINPEHPFATGVSPHTGRRVWQDNLLFASEPNGATKQTDDEIIERVMSYLAEMVGKSLATTENPVGAPSRMPPAINYIHGCVHFNGASMLFNDVREGLRFMTDQRFLREVRRFIRNERRELTIIFRDRNYSPEQLAHFSCLLKTVFPFFCNPNGNRKRLHWGVPAPYPNINLINGSWIRDTRMLLQRETRDAVARPPIPRSEYFRAGPYGNGWSDFRMPERALHRFTSWRVSLRGAQGGIYFVDAAKLRNGELFDPSSPPTLSGRMREKLAQTWR